MRNRIGGLAVLLLLGAVPCASADDSIALHPRSGNVPLPGTSATLHLGTDLLLLPPDEAKWVMIHRQGYSADDVGDVRGMILPAKNIADWQAVVTYKIDGHIDDIYAGIDNSDEILSAEIAAETDINAARREQKMASLSVQEWLQKPVYDKARHTLVWSRLLAVGSAHPDRVEASVATLSRGGVLLFNIVSDMAHAKQVSAATADLARLTTFAPGARYGDYREGGDRAAKYDTVGLVENEVGIPIEARKTGWDSFKEAWGVLAAIFAGFVAAMSWLFNRIMPKKKSV